jgi:hypothetical protein
MRYSAPRPTTPKPPRCGRAARARFEHTYDFFDAVMSADAELALWLHSGEKSADGLADTYRDAIKGVTATARELDSVTAQIRILGELLKCRGDGDDATRAEMLKCILNDPQGDTKIPGPSAAKEAGSKAPPPKTGAGKKKESDRRTILALKIPTLVLDSRENQGKLKTPAHGTWLACALHQRSVHGRNEIHLLLLRRRLRCCHRTRSRAHHRRQGRPGPPGQLRPPVHQGRHPAPVERPGNPDRPRPLSRVARLTRSGPDSG